MAWIAPRTWIVGEVVTKAILDTYIRDNQLYLYNRLNTHSISVHDDITRTFFISAMGAYTDGVEAGINNYYAIRLVDGLEKWLQINFMCPNDFVSITDFRVVWVANCAAGNMLTQGVTHYGASGEAYDTHGEDTGEVVKAIDGAFLITKSVLTGLFASIAKGDYCGLQFYRHGNDSADTIEADVYILGFL